MTPVTASAAVSGSGIRMHQRPAKSSAKPDAGRSARCRRPDGPGRSGPRAARGARGRGSPPLNLADIGQDGTLLQRRGDPPADLGIGGERGGDHDEIRTRSGRGRVVGRLVGSSRRTVAKVSARRAQATIRVPGLSRRKARASEHPISPMPISASTSASFGSPPRRDGPAARAHENRRRRAPQVSFPGTFFRSPARSYATWIGGVGMR
jgi:hypothetical protein